MRSGVVVSSLSLLIACDGASNDASPPDAPPPATVFAAPDGGADAESACPAEMVDVGGAFCIDRFEASLVAADDGRPLSPHHHPRRALAVRDHRVWEYRARRVGSWRARQTPLPELPTAQSDRDTDFEARSERGVVPSGYLDLESAGRACAAAGKRLCTRTEWTTACRGERGTRHPYGATFEPGRCNLGRQHPSNVLHGRIGDGLLDPRMNLVEEDGRPLLGRTGDRAGCASPWGSDAVHDMVGNLDEWIDEPGGTFVGGFYARDTQWGCDAAIDVHSPDYYDYGIGTRCCR